MKSQAKTDLVHVSHGKPFTDSIVIAENCELEHKNVIALIRKYSDDFAEFSPLAFETRKGIKLDTGGFAKSTEYAELTEDQATYLITLFRNTPIVRKFKLSLVKSFRKAINEIDRLRNEPDRKQAIQDKRDTARPMTDGLVFVRDMLGKKTGVNHFCNEHLFVNRALNGEWKSINESDLDTYDLRLLKAIRERNTLLIQHYPVQKDRKKLMDDFVAEYRKKYPRLQLVQ